VRACLAEQEVPHIERQQVQRPPVRPHPPPLQRRPAVANPALRPTAGESGKARHAVGGGGEQRGGGGERRRGRRAGGGGGGGGRGRRGEWELLAGFARAADGAAGWTEVDEEGERDVEAAGEDAEEASELGDGHCALGHGRSAVEGVEVLGQLHALDGGAAVERQDEVEEAEGGEDVFAARLGEVVQPALQLIAKAAYQRIEYPFDELCPFVPEAIPSLSQFLLLFQYTKTQISRVDSFFMNVVTQTRNAIPQAFDSVLSSDMSHSQRFWSCLFGL
jgi:hypothetical protein